MASPEGICEQIIRVLRDADNSPMKALDIANKLATNRKDISRLKKDINRVIFKMKEVEKADHNETPPRWRLKTEYIASRVLTAPSQANNQSSSYPNSSVQPQKMEKYVPHDLPTLECTATPPPPSVTEHSVDSQGEMSREQKVLETLTRSNSPLSALMIAQQIGLLGKRDVNPILFKLKEEGLVENVTSRSDNKPLWRATGPSHVRSLPNMDTIVRDDQHTALGSSSAELLSPAVGGHHHTSEGGDRELFTRTDSAGGAITFTPVGRPAGLAAVETPRQASSSISHTSLLSEVIVPIEESSRQKTQVPAPIQEGYSPQQVSQPIQVSNDDRATLLDPQLDPQLEPVAPPDPVNLVGPRQDRVTKSQKSAQAKDPGSKNMATLINDLNNMPTEECPIDSQTGSVVSTGDLLSLDTSSLTHCDLEETGSSLHSLSLTSEGSGPSSVPSVETPSRSQHRSSTSQGASNNPQAITEASQSGSETGPTGSESSPTGTSFAGSRSSKKRSSKRQLGIRFPGAESDT